MTPAADLACRIVTDWQGWEPLRPHWDALLQASPSSTPWQSWDFLTNRWRHVREDNRLRIFVVERHSVPCLIVPLQISTWDWPAGAGVRMLEPIGMSMDVNRPRFALGLPDPDAYACALEAIWRTRHEWHLIRIDEKLDQDPEVEHLREFAREHRLMFRQPFSHLCPYLDLRQDWNAYLGAKSNRLRKNLRAARRRLETLGAVSLRSYRTPAEIETAFDIVLALHEQSWKRRNKVEYSDSAGYRHFYRAWLQSMAVRDRARILVLLCNDRPVAATVAFMDETTYYSAQIVHDAEFKACSPGTLLEALEIEQLMKEQHFTTYDFLGSFLNNKLRWTDTAHATMQVFVMQHGPRNWLIDGYHLRLKPRFKPKLLKLWDKVRKRPQRI